METDHSDIECQKLKRISKASWVKYINQYRESSTAHGVRYVLDLESNFYHRLMWAFIMLGSTGLAVFSSLSMYLSWQEAPVLTTFGSDDLPISSLEFPSVILCSPGNNMAALPNISILLDEEWKQYWIKTNKSVLQGFTTLDESTQHDLLTKFVMHHIPGWPAELTLENFMLYMTTHLPALTRTLLLWAKEPEFRNKGIPVFDLLLNPDRHEELKSDISQIESLAVNLFQNMDFSDVKQQRILLNILWFTAQPCRKLLIHCSWKGKSVPCDEIFYPIPTDIGFCCAFNHNTLTKMLRGQRLAKTIQKIEEEFDKISDVGKSSSNPKNISKIDLSPKWGIQNGLTVVIDTMSEWSPASVRQDFLGIQAALKRRNQFPIMSRDSFLIRPGYETFVAITATHTTARYDLRSLPISKRKCYFSDEFHLQLFKSYSVKNCWMETLTNHSRESVPDGCVPWNFPSADKGVPICKPNERHIFLESFRMAEIDQLVVERCLPNCGGTSYDLSVTSAPFRRCDQANMGLTRLCNLDFDKAPHKWGDLMIESYHRHGDGKIPVYVKDLIQSPMRKYPEDKIFGDEFHADKIYNAFEKDIAVATFFFPRHTATELVKAPKMTTLDFLSQVGGILGLCVGVSLISGFEIIYWIFVGLSDKVYSRCFQCRTFMSVQE